MSGVVSWVWARECSLMPCRELELVSIYYLGVFWFFAVVLFFETGSHVVQAESDLELMILQTLSPSIRITGIHQVWALFRKTLGPKPNGFYSGRV